MVLLYAEWWGTALRRVVLLYAERHCSTQSGIALCRVVLLYAKWWGNTLCRVVLLHAKWWGNTLRRVVLLYAKWWGNTLTQSGITLRKVVRHALCRVVYTERWGTVLHRVVLLYAEWWGTVHRTGSIVMFPEISHTKLNRLKLGALKLLNAESICTTYMYIHTVYKFENFFRYAF